MFWGRESGDATLRGDASHLSCIENYGTNRIKANTKAAEPEPRNIVGIGESISRYTTTAQRNGNEDVNIQSSRKTRKNGSPTPGTRIEDRRNGHQAGWLIARRPTSNRLIVELRNGRPMTSTNSGTEDSRLDGCCITAKFANEGSISEPNCGATCHNQEWTLSLLLYCQVPNGRSDSRWRTGHILL